jgi:CRISPR-associated protein Cmr1
MKHELSCEAITPLAVHGADARQYPELRAPAFRGVIRYWYRALAGGTTLDNEMRVKENHIFGSNESAGTVAIRVTSESTGVTTRYERDRALRLPDGSYQPTGRDYLFWSMAESGRLGTDRHQPATEYFAAGTKFKVILQTRSQTEDSSLNQATAAFWLLSSLGSVGSRARRGAGSFSTQQSEYLVSPSLQFQTLSSVKELVEYLGKGIKLCQKTLGQDVQVKNFGNKQAAFDCLSPDTSMVWVVAGKERWSTWLDALNGLGSQVRDFRSHHRPLGQHDHDAMLDWFEGGPSPELNRPVFGLPIPVRYSNGGPSDVIQATNADRRSSPLHIHVTRLLDGSHVGVLTLFKSAFLEQGQQLKLQSRRWKASPPRDYSVIEEFIQSFPIKQQVSL